MEGQFLSPIEMAFNFNFTNCLIRFEDPNGDFSEDPFYDFSNATLYTDSGFNEDPMFFDTGKNDFNIETGTSGADGIGTTDVNPAVPADLNGTNRGQNPDAGAYESVVFQD